MKIVTARPPNYHRIAQVFDLRRYPGAIFAYGDTIYNPSGNRLSDALIAHETAHSERQGGDPDAWWHTYLLSAGFRLDEEIIAHRIEWRRFCGDDPNRHERRRYLAAIAGRLASPLYGSLLTVRRAKDIIRAEAA
jgi:hypothetical protein